MSQEDPGKPNFIPADGAPRGRHRASIPPGGLELQTPLWGRAEGEDIPVFIGYKEELLGLGGIWESHWPSPLQVSSPPILQFPEFDRREGGSTKSKE